MAKPQVDWHGSFAVIVTPFDADGEIDEAGFRGVRLRRAYLEVTANNDEAIRLYERLGFAKVRSSYRVVEVACS